MSTDLYIDDSLKRNIFLLAGMNILMSLLSLEVKRPRRKLIRNFIIYIK